MTVPRTIPMIGRTVGTDEVRYGTVLLLTACIVAASLAGSARGQVGPSWRHLSSADGELPVPNGGTQQTATAVFDADGDGTNDVLITDRSTAPSVVLYRRRADRWDRYVVEDDSLRIEAGSAIHDIDGDGDTDVVFGGDASSDEVWWWENPSPELDPDRPWQRHLVARTPGTKHHDQRFGNFDGDGEAELVFWNQGGSASISPRFPTIRRPADGRSSRYTPTAGTARWSRPARIPAERGPGTRLPAAEAWTGDLPGDGGGEWAYVEDGALGRLLLLAHHPDDDGVDSYWPMNEEMTVFAFGRRELGKFMTADIVRAADIPQRAETPPLGESSRRTYL